MGGGASKKKQSPPPEPKVPDKVAREPSTSIPTLYGPKNGELAPITAVPKFPTKTWNDVPIQPKFITPMAPLPSIPHKPVEVTPIVPVSVVPTPMDTRTVPPASKSPTISPSNPALAPPARSPSPNPTSPSPAPSNSSPPNPTNTQPENADPHKIKAHLLGDRKFSEGINSPITHFKHSKDGKGDQLGDEDQVVVDSDDFDEYDDPATHTFHKSVADKFYQDVFAEKSKVTPAPKESLMQSNPHPLLATSPPVAPSVSFQLSESSSSGEEGGLYTEYEDKHSALENQKKLVAVPTLQLGGLGEKKKPGTATAIVVSNKPPPEVAPVPRTHGNFDNDKFRAANAAKKKIAADSIFKQTTYDYKAANKSNSSIDSSNATTDRLSSPDFDSSSFGYSSDTSMDSPDAMRPPNTPTHKPAYDDFEENIMSSILDE